MIRKAGNEPITTLTYGELQQIQRRAFDWVDVKCPILKRQGKLPATEPGETPEKNQSIAVNRTRNTIKSLIRTATAGRPDLTIQNYDRVDVTTMTEKFRQEYQRIRKLPERTGEHVLTQLGIEKTLELLHVPLPEIGVGIT